MSAFDPPLSNRELAILLKQHGVLCGSDAELASLEKRIATIGYYRLEEYTWQFRKQDSRDKSKRTAYFKQKTKFNLIWNTYLFDRKLRFLLMDAIERFEIALRSAITHVLTDETGTNTPHADTTLFPSMLTKNKKTGKTRYEKWIGSIQAKYDDSGSYDPRIEHCKTIHGVHDVTKLPIWIVMELTTLGNLKTLYENMRPNLKNKLAVQLGVDENFLTSSLILLHQVRNRCAHHKRIWNYLWMKKVQRHRPLFSHVPVDPAWYLKYDDSADKWVSSLFGLPQMSFNPRDTVFVFILCGYWLNLIDQTSHWKERVESVVQPNGEVTKTSKEAGFLEGWEKHPLWNKQK